MTTRPLRAEDLYHTGIVVEDLDAATRDMTALAGYRWTVANTYPFTVWKPGSDETEVSFRFVYSLEAPHLELVQQIPGTVWTPAPGNAPHHLGYFVDDLAASSEALTAAGLPIEVCGSMEGQRPAVFAYHKGEDGIRIEIVDRSRMGDFDAYLQANAAPES